MLLQTVDVRLQEAKNLVHSSALKSQSAVNQKDQMILQSKRGCKIFVVCSFTPCYGLSWHIQETFIGFFPLSPVTVQPSV